MSQEDLATFYRDHIRSNLIFRRTVATTAISITVRMLRLRLCAWRTQFRAVEEIGPPNSPFGTTL